LSSPSYAEAVKWYRLAAAQGNAPAQGNLGHMYANGQGVPLDYAEALKWYRLAAEQGDASGQYNLGAMYGGDCVPRDYAEALKWYRLAADQGHADSQYMVGFMYARGWGVPQDYVLAHMWFNLAAAQSLADAVRDRDMIAAKMKRLALGLSLAALLSLTPAYAGEADTKALVCTEYLTPIFYSANC
jgi:TPR repeat protein